MTPEQKAAMRQALDWYDNGNENREEFQGMIRQILEQQPAQQQEPVAWRYNGNLHEFDPSDWATGPVTPLYTSPPAQQHDCSRSHPHENMDAMCELRTEIARLTNENARLKARHQDDEINAYRMTLLCIRDGLQQGMSKSIQKLQAREINDVLGLPSFASYRTSPQPSKPWVGLTPQDFTGMVVSDAFEAGAWWADVTLQEKNNG